MFNKQALSCQIDTKLTRKFPTILQNAFMKGLIYLHHMKII